MKWCRRVSTSRTSSGLTKRRPLPRAHRVHLTLAHSSDGGRLSRAPNVQIFRPVYISHALFCTEALRIGCAQHRLAHGRGGGFFVSASRSFHPFTFYVSVRIHVLICCVNSFAVAACNCLNLLATLKQRRGMSLSAKSDGVWC